MVCFGRQVNHCKGRRRGRVIECDALFLRRDGTSNSSTPQMARARLIHSSISSWPAQSLNTANPPSETRASRSVCEI